MKKLGYNSTFKNEDHGIWSHCFVKGINSILIISGVEQYCLPGGRVLIVGVSK